MSITFHCSCGKELEVFDSLAGQKWKCRQCGTWNTVPTKDGGTAAPSPAPPAASIALPVAAPARPLPPLAPAAPPAQAAALCDKCRKPIPRQCTHCPHCGWDAQADARRCIGCGGFVAFDHANISYSAGVGVVMIVVYHMAIARGKTGILEDMVAGAAMFTGPTALGCLMALLTTQYRCAKCEKSADPSILTPDERSEFRKKRLGFLIGAVALAAVTIGCGLLWYMMWKSRG